jgi:hypothetical protein
VQLNAELGALSDWRLNAPAAIFIVCGPWIATGELLKWKVICVLPLPNTNEFAAIPFTVKSLACTVDGLTAALRFITKSSGAVVTSTPQAGLLVATPKPSGTRLTNTSCCELPLMLLRPSVQAPMTVFPKELW